MIVSTSVMSECEGLTMFLYIVSLCSDGLFTNIRGESNSVDGVVLI